MLADDQIETAFLAFWRAVEIAGGQAATGRIAGVTQQAISRRLRRRELCGRSWVLPLEAKTGVSRHELRPDLYPYESAADTRRAAPGHDFGDMVEPAR